MDFTPSDDRRMLQDTLTRYLAEKYPLGHRNAVAYDAPFHDPEKWAELAGLGVLSALVPEAQGGFGGAGFDIATVFEALGAALCPEPVLSALMGARMLGVSGDNVDALMSGTRRYAVGLDGAVEVEKCSLTGRKSVVYGGHVADVFLVVVPERGVFEVEAGAARVTSYGMVDGGGAAELFLDAAPARRVSEDAEGLARVAQDAGALALSAEAVGAMGAAFEMLKEYLRTRQQFGRAIGSFQALQHRMVDLLTEIEQARSITILAASRLDAPDGSRTISMAKSLVGQIAKQVAEELIQMHGGIAMTWEHGAAHYAKRLVMIDHQLGSSDAHLSRVADRYQVT